MNNKKTYENFHTFIKKIIIKLSSKFKIRATRECKDILNNFIIEFTKNIIMKSCYMAKEYDKCKINVNNIKTIFKILYPGSNEILNKAYEHLALFESSFKHSETTGIDPLESGSDSESSESIPESKIIRSNTRADLIFHPTRFKNLFEKYKYANIQIYETSIIFLTSIIEIIISNVISDAICLVLSDKKITLNGEYIYKSVKNNIFFKNYDIIGWGLC